MRMRVYACMRGYVFMGAISEHDDDVFYLFLQKQEIYLYLTNTDWGLHTPTAHKSTLTHALPRAQVDTHRHKHRHTKLTHTVPAQCVSHSNLSCFFVHAYV